MAAAQHAMVPHYNIHGQQHHREPFKDKSVFEAAGATHHRWFEPAPAIRTLSELNQARRTAKVPDSTYDFDGDGVVGAADFLIGRNFDANGDGRLTTAERKRADKAIAEGYMDRFVTGLDRMGDAGRADTFRVQQFGGQILDNDNASAVGSSLYPPHFNSHKVPAHATLSDLRLARVSDLKASANEVGERYAQSCAKIIEPQPPNARTHPRENIVSNIRERSEGWHRDAREQGGLLRENTTTNPSRESMNVGLGYRHAPSCATRGELHEKRREELKRANEESRIRNDEINVPYTVRKVEREAKMFEFRTPKGDPKTLTKLKDDRRREKIEYDMANFGRAHRELPRFSDNPEVPFWMHGSPEKVHEHMHRLTATVDGSMQHCLRSHSEPVLKVTEVPFHSSGSQIPHNAPAVAATATVSAGLDPSAGKPGEKLFASKPGTVKRFTADYLERGLGLNKPRYFDSIQPIRVGPLDLQSLDVTSSMDIIRRGALADQALAEKRWTKNPRRSILWNDPAMESVEQESVDTTPHASLVLAEQRSNSREPRKRTSAAPRVQSDPSAREKAEKNEAMLEPRSFGSTTLDLRPSSKMGVRSGGFQRLDWPPRHGRTDVPRRTGRSRGSGHQGQSKDSARESVVAHPL